MKRSEFDRPCHPMPSDYRAPIIDTWKCSRCGAVHGIGSGWRIVGTGKTRRRICKPCHEQMME